MNLVDLITAAEDGEVIRAALVRDAMRAQVYVDSEISENLQVTPEGFLLCVDVPIARLGVQDYLPREVPIEDDGSGIVKIDRREDDVFRPETVASFEAKPVTLNHPPEFVNPDNWKKYAVGVVRNPRRGDGSASSLLIADLLITDASAILLVRSGLREVSCGYDAVYVQDAPGHGHQTEIVGNHVALVEKCRCGSTCSIHDEEPSMTKESAWDRLLKAFKVKDAAALEKALTTPEAKPAVATADTNAMNQKVLDALAGISKQLAVLTRDADPDKDGDDDTPAVDEDPDAVAGDPDTAQDEDETEEERKKREEEEAHDAILGAETAGQADVGKTWTGKAGDARTVFPAAEILAPGIKIRTGDTAISVQRRALEVALAGPHAGQVESFLRGKPVGRLTRDHLNAAFTGASQLVRHLNNAAGTRSNVTTRDFGRATTISKMNQAAREFWAKQGGK